MNDTDYTRENRIALDINIPITKENALRLFSMDGEDIELEYAVHYLEESQN